MPSRGDACPACGDPETRVAASQVRDFEYGAPGEFRWLSCSGCGLVRIDPMPSMALLGAAYPADYHAYVQPRSKLTRRLIAVSRRAAARRLAASLPEGAALLDVGCSTGELLAEVGRLGRYQLFGVEYKREAAEAARARGITVWEGAFEAAAIPPESMDLVVMQHVLEHVYDPVACLRKVHDVLKPGGRVLGELPNMRSWDAALFGRYWGGGHAPRHMWHFTPATLTRALRGTGFEVAALRPALHTGHWALSFQNFIRRNRQGCADLVSGRAWYYPLLLLLTIPVNLLQMPLLRTGIMRFEAKRAA